jgi:transcriptional regulator with XRE-family HTH domain
VDGTVKMRIALNLRRLRAERAVSLATLSRESGISRATLSKVEAGTGNPTVETLAALAASLKVSIDDVLSGEEGRSRVVRRDEGTWLEGTAVGYRLTDRLFGREVVDVYEIVFASGTRRESEGHGFGTFEHLFVTAGRLMAGPVDDLVDLRSGDYLRFPADGAHAYEAVAGEAKAMLLISYVRAPSGRQEMQRELEHLLSGGDESPAIRREPDEGEPEEATSAPG